MKNTIVDYNYMQIINWNRYETNTQGRPLFLDKHPRKNPMQENWCNKSEGFLFLSISSEYNSGCPFGNPVIEKKTLVENLVRLPHFTWQIPADPTTELTIPDYNCAAPSQELCGTVWSSLRLYAGSPCLLELWRQPSWLVRQLTNKFQTSVGR